MNTPWRTVLVGIGRMGQNHLRVLQESKNFEVVGLIDPSFQDHIQAQCAVQSIPFWNSIEECLSKLNFEVAVIASPTRTHFDVTQKLLLQNKHVLVEKPLAPSYVEAQQLIHIADQKKLVLTVGHLERLNPAIRKLKDILQSGLIGEPIHFSFTRVGGFPNQISSTDNVLMDLAVHDIDVLHFLTGVEPSFEILGVASHSTRKPGLLDTSEILLSRSSVSASIHVNWVTPTKIRNLRVTCTRGVCFVDYILQTCVIYGGGLLERNVDSKGTFESFTHVYQNSDRIEFGVDKEEPLQVQLREFDQALRGNSSKICTAEEAASTVRIAEIALQIPSNTHSKAA